MSDNPKPFDTLVIRCLEEGGYVVTTEVGNYEMVRQLAAFTDLKAALSFVGRRMRKLPAEEEVSIRYLLDRATLQNGMDRTVDKSEKANG